VAAHSNIDGARSSGIKTAPGITLGMKTMAKLKLFQPWWLEVGTEACSVCDHLYVYETEHRCNECDAPTCSHCIEPSTSVCLPCSRKEASIDIELEV